MPSSERENINLPLPQNCLICRGGNSDILKLGTGLTVAVTVFAGMWQEGYGSCYGGFATGNGEAITIMALPLRARRNTVEGQNK